MTQPQITFTPEKFAALRRAYQHAVETERESFEFEGHELLTSYAKYLLEYLSTRFA